MKRCKTLKEATTYLGKQPLQNALHIYNLKGKVYKYIVCSYSEWLNL